MNVRGCILLLLIAAPLTAEDGVVDASTLRNKVLCGYQGWFRCPGDGTREGWLHWSRRRELTADSVTVEMWPDLTEFDDDEKFAVPAWKHPDGAQAYLFSSANAKTVERHFRWMKEYDIDGVFVQRFLVNLSRPSFDQVLSHVRTSAAKTGRTYAVCYDLSGAPAGKMVDLLARDWSRLTEERKVTGDNRYLKHNGKPVVFVWGMFSDRFDAATAHRLIDVFRDRQTPVTLIAGCPWYWRREKDAEWARALRRFDVLSPWNVGNFQVVDGKKYAATSPWKEDLAETKRAGVELLPVIYPGFGWTNLQGKEAAKATIPRLGGEFYRRQFAAAAELGLDAAYVAMFDEVDEATAIFKVTNSPPTQAPFATYDGEPSDLYLRLTGEGAKLLRQVNRSSNAGGN